MQSMTGIQILELINLTAKSSLSDEYDNFGGTTAGDFTLYYHIDQIS